jgi:hypothetical protein
MIFRTEKYCPQIYTTGAFLRPVQMTDSEGKEMWVWMVERFDGGDSFQDGEIYNPVAVAGSLEKLLVRHTENNE